MCSLDAKPGPRRSLWPRSNWWRRQASPRNISQLLTPLFEISWKMSLVLDPSCLGSMNRSHIWSYIWNPRSFISAVPSFVSRSIRMNKIFPSCYSIPAKTSTSVNFNPIGTSCHNDWRENWIIHWRWSNIFTIENVVKGDIWRYQSSLCRNRISRPWYSTYASSGIYHLQNIRVYTVLD